MRNVIHPYASLSHSRQGASGGLNEPGNPGVEPAQRQTGMETTMQTKTIALAAALTLALSGAALAQTPAGGGSAEGNMNNPASVKSNSGKSILR